MLSIYFLAFSIGFLSLSQEILWVRLFGFTFHSLPQVFAFVLMSYLIGIALGAHIGKRFCLLAYPLWLVNGMVLILAGMFDAVSPWIFVELSTSHWESIIGGCLILLTGLVKAIVFPIVHQQATSLSHHPLGRSISKVYLANILGATLGPILTGLILLDLLTTQQCYAVTATFTFILGLFCLSNYFKPLILFSSTMLPMIFLSYQFTLKPSLLITKIADHIGEIKQIIETPQGIITIYKGNQYKDIVYGGNVYDGETNLNPLHNTNAINRILILSTLHDSPERVLVVGLSIGTWLKLITSFPTIKQIDVVEINPGYLRAIQSYPSQLSGLKDPRVHLYIDDGRRWLRMHASNKYDIIVMNTTFHWRAYASNLLSIEFLRLLKDHMYNKAILAYNTTGSPDVLKTAAQVFRHAYLYTNFVFAADFDWRDKMHHQEAIKKLLSLSLDGKPLFPKGSEATARHFLDVPTFSITTTEAHFNKLGRKLEVITDNNLITEYKYGYR